MTATVPIKSLSRGPMNHFFGYYAINAWDSSRRRHLALETSFHDRRPGPDDEAAIGLVDAASGEFEPFARTRAFNFQQGSMLHWINVGFGEEFTCNDWEGDRLVSRAINVATRARRTIQGAIEAVSLAAPVAVGLNFARMAHCRAVVGYANRMDPAGIGKAPDNDGLWRLDLASGKSDLIVSVAAVVAAHPNKLTQDGPAWLDHVYFNPSGKRLMFLCRIRSGEGNWHSSMWTINLDGSELALQIDYGGWISHFTWIDDRRILVSTDSPGRPDFYTFIDREGNFQLAAGGHLHGHAAFGPDGRWIVYDTSPDKQEMRSVRLYDTRSEDDMLLGKFHHPKPYRGDVRCDPHPRWRPDGKAVTFDSVHEGTRQIYLADLSGIVG